MSIKKNIITALSVFYLVFLIAFSAVSQTNNEFIINGKLEQFTDPVSRIYITFDPLFKKPMDSAIVKDGKYTIKGSIDFAAIVYLSTVKGKSISLDKDHFLLVLDKGTIDVVSTGTIQSSTVSGSGSEGHKGLMKATALARTESLEVNKIVQSKGYDSNDSLKNVVREKGANAIGQGLTSMITLVRQDPNASISPYLTYTLVMSGFVTPAMIDTLVGLLPEKVKTTSLGMSIDSLLQSRNANRKAADAKLKALDEKTPLGIKAMDFTMNDVAGKPVTLSSYKGKYVLIDFWASWCKPCREENPNLVKAYNSYKGKGFNVLGVSLDGQSQKTAWLAAIKMDGLDWTQVSDLKGFTNAAALLYGVSAIPQNFLISPDGMIVAKNLRGEALNAKLAEIFGK